MSANTEARPQGWFRSTKQDVFRDAREAYAAHCEVMKTTYPELADPLPWDDQDAAVREAWIEHVTWEEPWPWNAH